MSEEKRIVTLDQETGIWCDATSKWEATGLLLGTAIRMT